MNLWPAGWAFVTLLGVIGLLGCDVARPAEDDPTRGAIGPPMSLLRVEATTSYVDGHPQHATIAENGVLAGVAQTASIRLHFDRFLLPGRVLRQSICVRPILDDVQSLDDCAAPFQAFTEPDYSPVRRMVTFRLPAGARYQAQTRYRVTVFVPATADDNGFFAFDGAPLDRRYVFDFETQAPGGDEVEEYLPHPTPYCAAIQCFRKCAATDATCRDLCRPLCAEPTCRGDGDLLLTTASNGSVLADRPRPFVGCGSPGCHSALDPEGLADPSALAMGLDLYTITAIGETAVGVTAHQTQKGETGTSGTSSGLLGRAMPRIDARNPGNSYLLYKLIANPLNHPRPGGLLDAALFEELERLRASFVMGLPMPASRTTPVGLVPLESDPEGAKSFAELSLIETWIANGAVTSCAE